MVSASSDSRKNNLTVSRTFIRVCCSVDLSNLALYLELSNFKSTALRGSLEVGTMMIFKGYEAQVRGCEVQVRWCSEDSAVVR